MGSVMYIVKATIPPEREDEFNRWYDEIHIPELLTFEGVISGRRFKPLMGEDRWQYLAVYEFVDEAAWRRFMDSEHLKKLKADYDRRFGDVSERGRFAYLQIYP
ncbi:MAG TPA: DUF4286 family protein [Myxococcaceae bacterium]|jgi:antibiotic biosynthesis monooxygenase (ABM) superfamily enzyme